MDDPEAVIVAVADAKAGTASMAAMTTKNVEQRFVTDIGEGSFLTWALVRRRTRNKRRTVQRNYGNGAYTPRRAFICLGRAQQVRWCAAGSLCLPSWTTR